MNMRDHTPEQADRMRKFLKYLMSDEEDGFQAEWERWVIELYESSACDIETVLTMLNPEDDQEARTLIQVWESTNTPGGEG
jgi:hypothetical protein